MRRRAQRPAGRPRLHPPPPAAAPATRRGKMAAVRTVRTRRRFSARFWVRTWRSVGSWASTLPGVVSHSADSAPAKPADPVKPEPVQSNGPSHPAEEAPPTLVEDKNSNGCSQPAAPSHDHNGSAEPPTDTKETETPERPAKKCRLEAEAPGQSEAEPSRTQEN